jgi:RimJ/RimL family protein N-acetyltransferase
MFDYPLRQLGCVRITAPIADGNDGAIRFVTKLGFQLEGRLRKAMPDGADRLIYGLLKEDCKWL